MITTVYTISVKFIRQLEDLEKKRKHEEETAMYKQSELEELLQAERGEQVV